MAKIQKGSTFREKNHQNLLVLLKKAQEEFGYVPEEFIIETAKSLNTSISEVYGIVTFYSFLSEKPLGRNVIKVCQSLPCFLKNSEMIIKSVAAELGVTSGEATSDGRFCFQLTNCIGACDEAPAMMINSDVRVNLTPSKISQILKEYE